MRFSLLDRSRTRTGEPEAEALHDTLARAQRAEALGFHRFWTAEHHAVPGIASGAPALLLAAAGQRTERIRLGSGGVMLPQHTPLLVAEQFRMLEALHPGRIDLGAGRSLGFTAPVRRALRQEAASPEEFAADLGELLSYLDGSAPVTARPVTGPVPVHVLATRSGLEIAARLGLPVVVGGPLVLSSELPEALAEYRRAFRVEGAGVSGSEHCGGRQRGAWQGRGERDVGGQDGDRPHVILSLDVFAADTVERAEELALPEAWAMAQSREVGAFPPLESPAAIREQAWPDRVRRRMEEHRAQTVIGTHAQTARRLERLVSAAGADELMTTASTFDTAAQADLDAAFAELAAGLG